MIKKIAFGGGCHWCTEAVFQYLKGIDKVEQGYVASNNENSSFSEAVIVHFNTDEITLSILIEIHLLTHRSTSNHSMRKKYRSAIYVFLENQKEEVITILNTLKLQFKDEVITQVLNYKAFKPSEEEFHNYYFSNPEKPFCKTYIEPKLKFLLKKYSEVINTEKLNVVK